MPSACLFVGSVSCVYENLAVGNHGAVLKKESNVWVLLKLRLTDLRYDMRTNEYDFL